MNYKARVLAVLVAASIAPFAMASDGTINFTGLVQNTTCAVTVNSGGSTATVALPTVPASALSATGVVAGKTGFNIKLAGCSGASAAALFEAGTGVDAVSFNLKNTGAATNVQLQLLDSNAAVIKAGDAGQVTTNLRTAISSNAATMQYFVQYYATGVATGGTVLGSVTYSINYQ